MKKKLNKIELCCLGLFILWGPVLKSNAQTALFIGIGQYAQYENKQKERCAFPEIHVNEEYETFKKIYAAQGYTHFIALLNISIDGKNIYQLDEYDPTLGKWKTPLPIKVGETIPTNFYVDKVTINEAFDFLVRRLTNPLFINQESPKIIIAISAHGGQVKEIYRRDKKPDEKDGKDEVFYTWSATDLNLDKPANYITDDELQEKISRIRKAIHHNGLVHLMVDACFSGGFERALTSIEKSDSLWRGKGNVAPENVISEPGGGWIDNIEAEKEKILVEDIAPMVLFTSSKKGEKSPIGFPLPNQKYPIGTIFYTSFFSSLALQNKLPSFDLLFKQSRNLINTIKTNSETKKTLAAWSGIDVVYLGNIGIENKSPCITPIQGKIIAANLFQKTIDVTFGNKKIGGFKCAGVESTEDYSLNASLNGIFLSQNDPVTIETTYDRALNYPLEIINTGLMPFYFIQLESVPEQSPNGTFTDTDSLQIVYPWKDNNIVVHKSDKMLSSAQLETFKLEADASLVTNSGYYPPMCDYKISYLLFSEKPKNLDNYRNKSSNKIAKIDLALFKIENMSIFKKEIEVRYKIIEKK